MNYVPKFEDTSAAAKSVVNHREKVTAERAALAQVTSLAEHPLTVAAQRVLEANKDRE